MTVFGGKHFPVKTVWILAGCLQSIKIQKNPRINVWNLSLRPSIHPSIHPNLRQCTAILSAKCWFFIWRISLNNAVAFLLMSRPHWVEKIKTWANCEQDKLDIFYHLEYGKGDDLKTITLSEASHWQYVAAWHWKSLFQRKATTPGNVSHQPTWVEKIMNTWFLWKSQPKFLLKVPHQDSLRS